MESPNGVPKNLLIFGESGAPKELCSNGVSERGPQRAMLEWGVRAEARVACRLNEVVSTFATSEPNAGVLAHLVERNNGIVEVRSSSLLCSTKKNEPVRVTGALFFVEFFFVMTS